MRKRHIVVLSEEERARLHTMIGRGVAPASALTHARILLKANQGQAGPGWTDAAIAVAVEVNPATVARVRQQYVTAGLDAALRRKPPARQYHRRLDGQQEARLVARSTGKRRRRCGSGMPVTCGAPQLLASWASQRPVVGRRPAKQRTQALRRVELEHPAVPRHPERMYNTPTSTNAPQAQHQWRLRGP